MPAPSPARSQQAGWGDDTDEAVTTALCEGCKDSLLPKATLIAAVFSQLPVINADLQRSTRFGDINCQATWGVIGNLFGFCLNLLALLAFRMACYRSITSSIAGVPVEWSLGPGFVCLAVSISVKLLDAICHLLVPTPRERWQVPSNRLTLLEYLRLASPGGAELERGVAVVPLGGEEPVPAKILAAAAAAVRTLPGAEDEKERPRAAAGPAPGARAPAPPLCPAGGEVPAGAPPRAGRRRGQLAGVAQGVVSL